MVQGSSSAPSDGKGGDRPERVLGDWRQVLAHPDVVVHVDEGGRASLMRPDTLLFAVDDIEDGRLIAHATDLGIDRGEMEERTRVAREAGQPFVSLRLGVKVSPVDATIFLRALDGGKPLQVGPDHLLWPMQGRVLWPASLPTPARKPRRTPPKAKPTVDVAVIDSGLVEHALGNDPLLAHATAAAPLGPGSLDARWDDAAGQLEHWVGGHGTHVAGVVAQAAQGSARIHHYDVAKAVEGLPLVADSDLAAAVADALACGCRVLNLSLGGPTAFDLPALASTLVLASTVGRKGGKAGDDAVVVAAAGNEATTQPMYPAALKGVVAVGAVTAARGNAERAGFSNHGPWVDAAAAGVQIVGPYVTGLGGPDANGNRESFKGWAAWSGTSFAAPFVAGRIAAAIAGGIPSARVAAATVLAGGRPLDPALGLGVLIR